MSDKSRLFSPLSIGSVSLPNRIIRSATFEAAADAKGNLTEASFNHYRRLVGRPAGAVITGFMRTDIQGGAVQPGQAGFDAAHIGADLKKLVDIIHEGGSLAFCQIAHAGRQTNRRITGLPELGMSSRRSAYFGSKPVEATQAALSEVATLFGKAADIAAEAGFDGVQIHAAHGYLLHQALLRSINTRKDAFGNGSNHGWGTQLLGSVLKEVRTYVGKDYPVIFKLSGEVDRLSDFTREQFAFVLKFLEAEGADAVEISRGTMENPLEIFRGSSVPYRAIAQYNYKYQLADMRLYPLWRSLAVPFLSPKNKPFSPAYNLELASFAKKQVRIPIISVGGFRTEQQITEALAGGACDAVALCRPFLSDTALVDTLFHGGYKSRCVNCNLCAVMCDSGRPVRCWKFSD